MRERRNEAFYLGAEVRGTSTADRLQHGLSKRDSAETQSQHRASGRTQRQGRAAPTRNAQSDVAVKCYECGGGHFDRECPTGMKRLHPRKPHENRRASSFLLPVQMEAAEYHAARLNLRRGKPTVRVNIRGVSRGFIVDSGSSVSLIQPGIYRSEVRPSSTTSFGLTGDEIDILGEQDVQFSLNN